LPETGGTVHMVEEKKIKVGVGRQAILKPQLNERPPLGPVVAVVRFATPWWRGAARRTIIKFLDGLVAAYRIRARDELDLTITQEGNRVVVRRRLNEGRVEVRFERDGRARGTLHCDHRELENLHALGILAGAKVYRPTKVANEMQGPPREDAGHSG
jgi:hypothetical protein